MPRRVFITLFALLGMLFSFSPAMAGSMPSDPSATFKFSNKSIVSGLDTLGIVTLSANATRNMTFQIENSDDTIVTVPTTVKVAKGKKTASFPVKALWVSKNTKATITLTFEETILSADVNIEPLKVLVLTFDKKSTKSGGTIKGTIKITGPAPEAGAVVKLSAKGPLTVSSSVTVKAGKNSASFTINSKEVTKATSGSVTASYRGTLTGSLTVNPSKLTGLSLQPETVMSGSSTVIVVTIDTPAPASGIAVKVSGSGINTPEYKTTITIAKGQTTGSVEFEAPNTGGREGAISFTATYNGTGKSANLTITPLVED